MRQLDGVLRWRLARFAIVGAGTAGLLMVLTYGLIRAGAPPFAAGFGAYAVCFVVAYTLQRNWTFQQSAGRSRSLPRYLVLQAGCALLSAGLSDLLARALGWPPAWASAAMTLCVAAISYVVSSRWVFADDNPAT